MVYSFGLAICRQIIIMPCPSKSVAPMKNASPNSQTAYSHNLSPNTPISEESDFGWCYQINAMLKNGYSFLPSSYEDRGFLFRGMSCGLTQAIETNHFWHFDDPRSVTQLEQELDVMFISQDFSDAYGVSRMWEDASDSGLLVLNSSHYNQQLEVRQAAMLAFAEPGVVFNYPFLCLPLLLEDLAFILVNDQALAERIRVRLQETGNSVTQVFCPDSDLATPAGRSELETCLLQQLEMNFVSGADLTHSEQMPRRIAPV